MAINPFIHVRKCTGEFFAIDEISCVAVSRKAMTMLGMERGGRAKRGSKSTSPSPKEGEIEAIFETINSEDQSKDQEESQLIMHPQNRSSHMNTKATK